MAFTQRLPKLRGFRNPVSHRWASVSLAQLEGFAGKTVNLTTLAEAKLIDRQVRYVKIIGAGPFGKKLTVDVQAVSKGARQALEKSGSTVKIPDKAEVADA